MTVTGSRIILRVVGGPGSGIETTLQGDQVVEVGRGSRGLAIPDDERMSRHHFLLVCDGEECRLRDLSSANGTFLNGTRVVESTLRNLDEIKAGRSTFVLHIERSLARDPGHPPGRGPDEIDQARVPQRSDPGAADVTATAADTVRPGDLVRVTNDTPFPTALLYWEDENGRATLTLILKATFTIGSPVTVAREQLAILRTDVHHGGDASRSVRFESDLVPRKRHTDVVLVGRAHAPQHRPVKQLVAGLRVGTLRHAVAVFGDRVWQQQTLGPPTMSSPRPFETMDLVYERAFGGHDAAASMYCRENPVGTGFIGKRTRERVQGLALPNLEDRSNAIRAWDSRPRPTGFGFYGRGWTPRVEQAGTLGFFNAAHPCLQADGYLRGDEDVELVNLCREPHVRFRLPGIRPSVRITRWTRPVEEVVELAGTTTAKDLPVRHEPAAPALDTLVFVPDEGVFYEVFRVVCDLPGLDSVDVARVSITL
jgi:pSer/pThr/pTyr-binding forkhead associated (FHA) protein